MSAKVTETDLAELKDFLGKKFDTIEGKIETLQKDVIDLKIGQAKTNEKIDGISTRLGILESKTTLQINWFLEIVTGLVGGLLTFIFRFFSPNS